MTQTIPHSDHFQVSDGELRADGVSLMDIAAQVQTPCFVYSAASIDGAYKAVDGALAGVPHLVAYAVKANSNLSVLRRLANLGSGADIVSGGELARALEAGFPAERIAFSGVGKTDAEIIAALDAGIRAIHAESEAEVFAIEAIARDRGVVAPIVLRVNPNVDANTHPYISTGLHSTKFGLEFNVTRAILPRILESKHLMLEGLACHVGSMVLDPAPIGEATQRVAEFAVECAKAGAKLKTLDAGGGWPIIYGDEGRAAESHKVFGESIIEGARRGGALDLGVTLMVEPGRSIVGDAGVLLTKVLFIKEQAGKRFVIVDGAMTELIRPALYSAYHAILPVTRPMADLVKGDVVGPVCESTDFFAKDRELPKSLSRGDLLAVRGSGAYAAVMGSNYNTRMLVPEVMVEDGGFRIIRRRQTLDDVLTLER